MGRLSSRIPFDGVLAGAIALTVVAFAAGSSSVGAVKAAGGSARWVVLALLGVMALAYAASRAPFRHLVAPPALPAFALVGLALLSAAWSVDPALSAARALSLGVLFVTAAALAVGVAGGPDEAARLLSGVLAGITAVALASLAVLALSYDDAIQPASIGIPARYQGLGENPNTIAILLALGLPLAGALALERSPGRRAAGLTLVLLFAGSIAASGSRAALIAGFAALLVVVLLVVRAARTRIFLILAVVAGAVIAVAASQIPDPIPPPRVVAPAPASTDEPVLDLEATFPLDEELGRPLPGRARTPVRPRPFIGSSGRIDAWRGTLEQAAERPILGFGFGTEAKVFVDRWLKFVAGLPENSYVGLLLQLGLVGVALLLVALASLAWPAIRLGASRTEGFSVAAGCVGVVTAAVLLGVAQSYLTSVGNVATSSAWICAFLGSVVGATRRAVA